MDRQQARRRRSGAPRPRRQPAASHFRGLRIRATACAILALVLAAITVAPAAAERDRDHKGDRGNGLEAVIRYTEHGIPHIKADDYAGLGYGYGHAVARDNICVLADMYLTLSAERSATHGPETPPNPVPGLTITGASTNLASDVHFQAVNDSGIVEELVALPTPRGPSDDVEELVRGYVAGYNRYLDDTGVDGITDPACSGAGWVRPISELDVYRYFRALATMTGEGQVIDALVTTEPGSSAGPALSAAEAPADVTAAAETEQAGSNAIAIGADASTRGGSVLLGNPHFPWHGNNRFWQFQFTIPGEINVSGASLLGFPMVQIGHNRDVAWSHTVSTASTFGLFEVQLVAGDPTSYLVDGEPEAMTTQTVEVPALSPDGSTTTIERTIWSTRYGPVIDPRALGLPPSEGTALSLRDANATNLRTANTWAGLGRASDVDEIVDVLSESQGIPWVNTVAADRDGKALYADVQVVPHVTDELAQVCSTPLGQVVLASQGTPILDGGRSECAWGSDDDAVEPGLLGPDRQPVLIRDDYVANSNDSPWLSNPEEPLTDYPRIIGDVATTRNPRTREALTAIEQRLDGSDGFWRTGFSRRTLAATLASNHSYVAAAAAADTATMCASFPDGLAPSPAGPVAVGPACDTLAAWDHTFGVESRGAVLFGQFAQALETLGDGAWVNDFDPVDPVNTPNTLDTGSAEVQQAFGAALATLDAAGVPYDAALGEVQQTVRGDEVIPLPGAPSLTGTLNAMLVRPPLGLGPTDVIFGSSFIQVVELPRRRWGAPLASTLLAYSQSTDPTSPYYSDQTQLFSEGRWVRSRFTELQIYLSPELRVERLRD